jgi:hypothetical protein
MECETAYPAGEGAVQEAAPALWDEDKIKKMKEFAKGRNTEYRKPMEEMIAHIEKLQARAREADDMELMLVGHANSDAAKDYDRLKDLEMQRDEATSAHQHLAQSHHAARISWAFRLQKAKDAISEIQDEFDRFDEPEPPHAEYGDGN